MAGEIVAGKRTYIERHGREFELPDQHTVKVNESEGLQTVALHTPGAGGTYFVARIEETVDRVIDNFRQSRCVRPGRFDGRTTESSASACRTRTWT